jgi:integrase
MKKYLNLIEIEKLKEFSKGTLFYYFILLSSETGARPSEILALHWEDVDFANNTISVNKSLSAKGKINLYSDINCGIRKIPVRKEVINDLEVLEKDSDLVFNFKDKTIKQSDVYQCLGLIYRRAEMKNHGIYIFRRSFENTLIDKGVNIKVIKYLLGFNPIEDKKDYIDISLGIKEYKKLLSKI